MRSASAASQDATFVLHPSRLRRLNLAETIALVGGDTLLGREVREILHESSLGDNVRLLAAEEEETGKITEIGGEAAFVARLDPEELEDSAAIVLAGPTKEELAGFIVDLTYSLEDEVDARLRAPLLAEADEEDTDGPQVVAHPASVAIAMLLNRVHNVSPVSNALVHIFEPASQHGKEGMDEMQQQAVNLMSFQPLPKKVFDAQVAFAMMPGLKTENEERIERHLATLLDRLAGPPMPSLRLIQAPVFHGYTFSVWIEFEDAPSAQELEEVLGADPEAPTNVTVAGQSGISVGAIAPDRNNGNALWIWMAADNLRLQAESAAQILKEAL